MKKVSATVVSNQELTKGSTKTPQVNLICVEAADIGTSAKPGQFVMVNCGPEVTLRRPLSIHRIGKSGQAYLLFSVIGKGTLWLSRQQKEDKLDILGPLGNGFSIEPTSKKMLLIAGGIGIAPLAFLAQQAVNQGKQVTFVLGARKKEHIYRQNLPHSRMETIILTDDGSDGIRGKVSDFSSLPDYIKQSDQIFACGPLPMYQALSNLIQRMSLNKNIQVSLSITDLL